MFIVDLELFSTKVLVFDPFDYQRICKTKITFTMLPKKIITGKQCNPFL